MYFKVNDNFGLVLLVLTKFYYLKNMTSNRFYNICLQLIIKLNAPQIMLTTSDHKGTL